MNWKKLRNPGFFLILFPFCFITKKKGKEKQTHVTLYICAPWLWCLVFSKYHVCNPMVYSSIISCSRWLEWLSLAQWALFGELWHTDIDCGVWNCGVVSTKTCQNWFYLSCMEYIFKVYPSRAQYNRAIKVKWHQDRRGARVECLRFGEPKELDSDNLHARSRAGFEARIFLTPDKPRGTCWTSIRGKSLVRWRCILCLSTFISDC
jgi:hypothetical protein